MGTEVWQNSFGIWRRWGGRELLNAWVGISRPFSVQFLLLVFSVCVHFKDKTRQVVRRKVPHLISSVTAMQVWKDEEVSFVVDLLGIMVSIITSTCDTAGTYDLTKFLCMETFKLLRFWSAFDKSVERTSRKRLASQVSRVTHTQRAPDSLEGCHRSWSVRRCGRASSWDPSSGGPAAPFVSTSRICACTEWLLGPPGPRSTHPARTCPDVRSSLWRQDKDWVTPGCRTTSFIQDGIRDWIQSQFGRWSLPRTITSLWIRSIHMVASALQCDTT